MNLRTRRPIDSIQGDERRQLVAAFKTLFDAADSGSNYAFWASIHTSCCEHASALFLPWHRAYIFAFENALRAAVGSELTLPYWDWCRTPALPSLLDELDAVIEPPNKKPERYTEEQRVACGAPALPTQADVDAALSVDDILDLGGPLCAPDFKGTLEGVHGVPHLWVGPWMASQRFAAFDPVFWFHHANVDRLWAVWQTRHPGQSLGCQEKPLKGIPCDWHVRDVLTIGSLGYEYATDVTILSKERHRLESALPIEILVPASGRVELRLTGIHAMIPGPGPNALAVSMDGQTLDRCSLFGVVEGCPATNPPVPVDVPGCDAMDHSHEMLSVRFDLTSHVAKYRGLPVTVVIQPEGGPRDVRPSLMVSTISVATLPI